MDSTVPLDSFLKLMAVTKDTEKVVKKQNGSGSNHYLKYILIIVFIVGMVIAFLYKRKVV